jgi:predicted dehydrogenase
MKQVQIGLIGCGTIAFQAHFPAVDSIPEARVVAVSSRSEASAKRGADRCGLSSWFTDSQKLIDHPDVEAVVICVPPADHLDLTLRAATAGKHVLCEKPMARSVEECDQMIEACHKANVTLMIAEMKRFDSGYHKVKKLIDEGVIGDVFMAQYHTSYHAPFCRESWFSVPDISGGGQMMNQLPHSVSGLRLFVGEVVKVTAMTSNPLGPPPEDNAAVVLGFENGAIGTVTTSWMARHYNLSVLGPKDFPYDEWIDVYGREGTIHIDTPFPYWKMPIKLSVYTERELPNFHRGWNIVRCPIGNVYVNQMRNFVRSVLGEETCEYPGEEGRADIAVIKAAEESAETERTVTL